MDGAAAGAVKAAVGARSAGAGAQVARPRGAGFSLPMTLQKLRLALFSIYIIPLVVITYLYATYIYPMFTEWGQDVMGLGISAVLTFAVVLSILGLALISRTANDSIGALRSLNDRMDRLLDTARHIDEAGYVDTLVNSIARSAKEILGAEASSLLLYDREGNLRFEYVEGPASRYLKGKVLRSGEGIAGHAAKEGRPVVVNDVQADPRFSRHYDNDSGFTTRSVICVPLVFSGKTLGVLEVINKRWDIFTEQDQQTLVTLADHAAAAIYRNGQQEEMKSDFVQALDIIMTAVDNHLPEKKGHARRVARYSVKLAKCMGLPEDEVRKVYFGALLHDIGFLRFDATENLGRDKLRLHPAIGSEMVKKVGQWADVAPLIHDHHERYDGTGYPSGLRGKEISIGGRIIALAEALDVMTHTSYKQAVSFEEAVVEVRASAGCQFDPDVANAFFESFRNEDVADD